MGGERERELRRVGVGQDRPEPETRRGTFFFFLTSRYDGDVTML